MTTRRTDQHAGSPNERPVLTRSRSEVEARVNGLIARGENTAVGDDAGDAELVEKITAFRNWREYTRDYLLSAFSNSAPSDDFDRSMPFIAGAGRPPLISRIKDHNFDVQTYVRRLKSLAERLELFDETPSTVDEQTAAMTKAASSTEVFIVHGHDEALRERVARFIGRLDLIPVILNEQANQGRTLIEKLEGHSEVTFAVVLVTPDDEGRLKASEEPLALRPRQNVVFELGYFIGKLGRARVSVIGEPSVADFSDFRGTVTVHPSTGDGWQLQLARELRAAGFSIDLNRAL